MILIQIGFPTLFRCHGGPHIPANAPIELHAEYYNKNGGIL